MVAKYKVNCTICKKSRADPVFRRRLYAAFYERDTGDETPTGIAKELGLNPASVMNHLKRHTKINPVKAPALVATHIAKVQAQINKEAELAIDHEEVIAKEDYEKVIDSVLAEGLDQMKKQGKQISISQLLTAAKIKADYSMKRRGQDAELIKTMYRLATGTKEPNGTEERHLAETDGGMDTPGPERPGDIHKSSSGYAFARGAEALPQGNA